MNDMYIELLADLIAKTNCIPATRETLRDLIEIPDDDTRGDYALPCFSFAKILKKSPEQIAKNIAEAIVLPKEFSNVFVVGGYINCMLNKEIFIENTLKELLIKKENYFKLNLGNNEIVVLEYSSPNIAKPFSISHLRSTNIGNALYKILTFVGYNVIGINHVGDWGTQFGKLIVAYKRWGSADFLKEDPIKNLFNLYVRFHKEAEHDPKLIDEARENFKKMEEKDESLLDLWKWFSTVYLNDFKRIYAALGVRFDHITGESFYNDKINSVFELLRSKNLTHINEGALIVDLTNYDMPPLLVKKSDDSSLYATRDLAALLYRKKEYKFTKILYVVGAEQKLYFKQLFKTIELMGLPWASLCTHIDFGLFHFKEGKMASRTGNIIELEKVIQKAKELALHTINEKNPELEGKESIAESIAIGAIKFSDFASKRIKDVLFDWDEMLRFDGETGPYLQYTNVRILSLLRKFGKDVDDLDCELSKLETNDEFLLVKALYNFTSKLFKAATEYEPSYIAQGLIDIAKKYNKFYNSCRILEVKKPIAEARIALSYGTHIVLKLGLSLLGISTPEKM